MISEKLRNTIDLTTEHGKLHARLARTYASINTITSSIVKIDLLKIYKGITVQWSKLDNEMIACRTWNKLTPAYHTLAKDIEDRLKYLDKHLMWAKLHG